MAGDMILGIQDGILLGTAHIGADIITGVGEASTPVGILHGQVGTGVHLMDGAGEAAIMAATTVDIMAATMVVMVDITAAIGDIIITTASRDTVISMDAQLLHVRAEIMQAVTVRQDLDQIFRLAEACQHALHLIEVLQYAVTKQGAAHH